MEQGSQSSSLELERPEGRYKHSPWEEVGVSHVPEYSHPTTHLGLDGMGYPRTLYRFSVIILSNEESRIILASQFIWFILFCPFYR